jgi:hypothetical protein
MEGGFFGCRMDGGDEGWQSPKCQAQNKQATKQASRSQVKGAADGPWLVRPGATRMPESRRDRDQQQAAAGRREKQTAAHGVVSLPWSNTLLVLGLFPGGGMQRLGGLVRGKTTYVGGWRDGAEKRSVTVRRRRRHPGPASGGFGR